MAHPMMDKFRSTYHSKYSNIADGLGKNEIQPDRAERITGITPSETIPKASEQAVPQFKEDRRSDDPAYGK